MKLPKTFSTTNNVTSGYIAKDREDKNHQDEILEHARPEQLNLRVLQYVAEAFRTQMDPGTVSMLNTFCDYKRPSTVHFEFEKRTWAGTVQAERSQYHGRMVKFVNVTMPNCGFVYSDKYIGNAKTETITEGEESDILVTRLFQLFVLVPMAEVQTVQIYFKAGGNRTELYIWLTNDRCITIKFEYGSHSTHSEAPNYDLARIMSLLRK